MGNLVNTITIVVVKPDVTLGIVMSFHTTLKVVGAYTGDGTWSSYQIVTIFWNHKMWVFFQVNKFYIHNAKISIKVEITKLILVRVQNPEHEFIKSYEVIG